jgi:hypothetical protein
LFLDEIWPIIFAATFRPKWKSVSSSQESTVLCFSHFLKEIFKSGLKLNAFDDQGSMLWSQFSANFRQFSAKKLAFFLKTIVMIKILHNLALLWVKNAIFCWNFRRKYFKNHNIGPRVTRLGDFSPVGRLFTLGRFLKILEVNSTFSTKNVLIFTKMGWATFWAIFSPTHLVALLTIKHSRYGWIKAWKVLVLKSLHTYELGPRYICT